VLAGSLGVLGVICEVSLKVLPRPAAVQTIRFEWDQAKALNKLNEWGGQPWPIAASAWWEGMLVLRLSGAVAAVDAAVARLGGEVVAPALAEPFWLGLRDHTDEFFLGALKAVAGGATLWRLSLPQTAPPVTLSGELLVEWGGAQRWLCTSAAANVVREAAQAAGGHATVFRSNDPGARAPGVFTPLPPALARIHRELKKAFDPAGIFNPGRLYKDL
jgi:glycolate oxidase FAD binding subunit